MHRIVRLFTMCLAAALDAWAAADAGTEFADTLAQRLVACSFCHGKQGEGHRENEYYPRIAGKPAEYLYRQLVNFRDGRRTYPQMVYMSRHLSDEYLREILPNGYAVAMQFSQSFDVMDIVDRARR